MRSKVAGGTIFLVGSPPPLPFLCTFNGRFGKMGVWLFSSKLPRKVIYNICALSHPPSPTEGGEWSLKLIKPANDKVWKAENNTFCYIVSTRVILVLCAVTLFLLLLLFPLLQGHSLVGVKM